MNSDQSTKPCRVGLIGAGMIGQLRARAIRQMPHEFQLQAVADPREDLAKTLAGDNVRIYGDGKDLAGDDEVDAVVVCTPPALHEEPAIACLEAGKHVLCEKPLAESIAACERMVTAAEATGTCLATGFTFRHSPAAKLARKLFQEGAIGDLDHIRAFHGHAGGSDFGPAWITEKTMTGGGTLMDNGIHVIDLARWFLGDVVNVMSMGSNHTWKKNGCEDNGFVLMQNDQGKVAQIHSSWTEWRGYGWRFEIYGTEGAIHFGFPPLWLRHGRARPGNRMKFKRHFFPGYQVRERIKGWEWSLVETLVEDLRDWRNAIHDGTNAPSSGRDGLEAVRIAQSIAP